ncbi:unnamed protein product [Clonostachys rhizophaga]|uniref:Uncharacterized protein n=1 Tax=Clonostachys rhizophaga TaxID=160324 RepID=A0A9N9V5I1_9HYPO|nr:unnamed protein product [Clonostachys rhizophaga]
MEAQETPRDVEMSDQQQQQPPEIKRPAIQLQTQQPSLNAVSPNFGERLFRLKTLGQEEMREFNERPNAAISMTPKEYEEVAKSLKAGSVQWKTAARWLSRWYVLTQDEDRARQFFRAWFLLKDQFWDKDQMTVPKGTFTISCAEIDQFRPLFDSMARDLEQARPVSFNQGLAQNNTRLQTHQDQGQSTHQLLSGLLTPQSVRSFWNDPATPQTPIAREQGWGYSIGEKLAISTNNQGQYEMDDKTPIAPTGQSVPFGQPPRSHWQFAQDSMSPVTSERHPFSFSSMDVRAAPQVTPQAGQEPKPKEDTSRESA